VVANLPHTNQVVIPAFDSVLMIIDIGSVEADEALCDVFAWKAERS